jgi:hypothetical protein
LLIFSCNAYRNKHKNESSFHVYRGQILSLGEIEQLRANVQKLISMNGFCSTSRNREMAVKFAKNVLFDIEIDFEKHPALIFADIATTSQFNEEQEVLFDLATVFRIERVSDMLEKKNLALYIATYIYRLWMKKTLSLTST